MSRRLRYNSQGLPKSAPKQTKVLGPGTRNWTPPPPGLERRPPQLPPMRNIKGDRPEVPE